MLDLKKIRENPEEIEKKLQTKDPTLSLRSLIEADEKLRITKIEGEKLKGLRNARAKEIGEKKRKGEECTSLIKEMESVGEKIGQLDLLLKEIEEEVQNALSFLPNLPAEEVKVSLHPEENEEIGVWGTQPAFSFKPKNHLELNEQLHLFDFKRGAKIGGSGWPTYRGIGARLEWALIQFMLETHIQRGFELWMVPLAAKPDILFGSAHLPKFEEQLFKVGEEKEQRYLIPTSEAALNGLHYGEILPAEQLPLRYTAYTPCFRREAGAAGAQERGLIRTHQFNKVEMFCITKPEESEALYQEMIESAEKILQELELHYRSMRLVTGDISFAAAKTIDLEVWLPGQKRYYEVSSLSHCTDFQARRSKMRYKESGDKPHLVHTLNGSGLATSRLMVALLENHQREDGSVQLPQALRPYLGGIDQLTPQ